jgi:hypothetical protein
MFKLHESSLQKHVGERSLKASSDDILIEESEDIPVVVSDEEDDNEDTTTNNNIKETVPTTTTTSNTTTAVTTSSNDNVPLKSSLRTLGFGVTYDSNSNEQEEAINEDTEDKVRYK